VEKPAEEFQNILSPSMTFSEQFEEEKKLFSEDMGPAKLML